MAGNTQCYRVTIDAAGALVPEVVQFSPRYADNVGNAMHRLIRRWAERVGEYSE